MSETHATPPGDEVVCDRCGKTAPVALHNDWPAPPPGWEGTVHAAVCPNCQYAEWHPHCTSLIDVDGERVDPGAWDAFPEAERDYSRLAPCEYIDTSVAWTDDDETPTWRCPSCGGSTFEGVHRDYPPSGFGAARYRVNDVDEP